MGWDGFEGPARRFFQDHSENGGGVSTEDAFAHVEAHKAHHKIITLSAAENLVENYCSVGDPIIIEWKGRRYPTLFRGAKSEIISTNITGTKARLAILPETSYLMVDMPHGYAAAHFALGSPLTVRFLYGGSVYAFKSAVMLVHNHPPMLVLAYPDREQRFNFRESERVAVVSPAQIFFDGPRNFKAGAMLNLSESGAMLALKAADKIAVGREIFVTFELPNGRPVSNLAAIVRNVEEEPGKNILGASFENPSEEVSEFCREVKGVADEAMQVKTDMTLGLGKSAVIDFAHKNGKMVVRGWKSGANGFILTDKPHGPVPPLSPGDNAVIRTENEGTVFSMAVVYKEFFKKIDVCHFSMNSDLVTRKLRAGSRFFCLIPATAYCGDMADDKLGEGVIVNLGPGGLRFITASPLHLELEDPLCLSFHLGGNGFVERQKMSLLRMSGYGNRFEYSTKFLDASKEHLQMLENYFNFYRDWVP